MEKFADEMKQTLEKGVKSTPDQDECIEVLSQLFRRESPSEKNARRKRLN